MIQRWLVRDGVVHVALLAYNKEQKKCKVCCSRLVTATRETNKKKRRK